MGRNLNMKQIKKEGNNIKITEETTVNNVLFIDQQKQQLEFIKIQLDQAQKELIRLQDKKVELEQNISDFKLP